MNKRQLITKTEEFVKKKMKGDPGHDWSHIKRVCRSALYIAKKEKADLLVVELAALLHDIGDYKFHGGDEHAGSRIAKKFLIKLNLDAKMLKEVCSIIDEVSFKGAKVKSKMKSLEGKIVQDADKLDALGAIGIGRTFVYAGHFGISMYDPSKKPTLHKSFEQYKNNQSSVIIHFYEKLLLLKDRMNTKTGKKLAVRRHKFMLKYLEEFMREWKNV